LQGHVFFVMYYLAVYTVHLRTVFKDKVLNIFVLYDVLIDKIIPIFAHNFVIHNARDLEDTHL